MIEDWEKLVVAPADTIKSVIEVISLGRCQIALVANKDKRLVGTVTDGDVRRGLLQGMTLENEASSIMNAAFSFAAPDDTQRSILATMRKLSIHHMPLLDSQGVIMGMHVLDELINPRNSNPVLLMAGGTGTRLLPLTHDTPKPMLKVGGKPILETILESFIYQGFENFYISVNYLAHVIQEYFGDGSQWGVTINYLVEDKKLGTAGALGIIKERFDQPILMMNGDLLTRVDYISLLDFHTKSRPIATMCVRPYKVKIPYGTVVTREDQVIEFREKPEFEYYVNAGIYVLEPELIEKVGSNCAIDMPDLLESARQNGRQIAAFPIHEYWIDLGQHDELQRANSDFKTLF